MAKAQPLDPSNKTAFKAFRFPPTFPCRFYGDTGRFPGPPWPQSQTLAAFPAKANATVEEARVLWEQGNYADPRTASWLQGGGWLSINQRRLG